MERREQPTSIEDARKRRAIRHGYSILHITSGETTLYEGEAVGKYLRLHAADVDKRAREMELKPKRLRLVEPHQDS
jgi:hypothetical protein